MDKVIKIFIHEGLWILLDGLSSSSVEEQAVDTFLNTKVTDERREENQKIVQHRFQELWLVSRLLPKLPSSSGHFQGLQKVSLMLKEAQLEQLLQLFPETIDLEVQKELYQLLRIISDGSAIGKVQNISAGIYEMLQKCLLEKPFITLNIIRNLYSPCIPEFADSDAALTCLCNNALEIAINRITANSSCSMKGALLVLLSTVTDAPDCLVNVKVLVSQNLLTEEEVHLVLTARGGNPPCLLQAFCALEDVTSRPVITNDGQIYPRHIFVQQSQTKQHWVLDFLKDCFAIITQEIPTVTKSTILAQHPTSLLSPLLLLMAWDQMCCDEETIALLVKFCKNLKSDKVLDRIAYLLERQANVVKWIKLQNKKYTSAIKANVLGQLQKCSTLRVLHETGCLPSTDWSEVEQLLKLDTSRSSDTWELTLFHGFCIMAKTLNLIWTSVRKFENVTRKVSNKLAENVPKDTESENVEQLLIAELSEIRILLQKIEPLSFRIELLENIFSLIFLRYEDVRFEEATSDSGGEDEDDSWKQSSTTVFQHGGSELERPSETLREEFYHPGSQYRLPDIPSLGSSRSKLNERQINRGFICTPLIIREILNCLTECLVDCTAAFYNQRKGLTLDMNSNDAVVEKQIKTLSQYTAEALWRLKLVIDLPVCSGERYIPDPLRGYPSTASSSDSDEPHEDRRRFERVHRRMSRSDHTDKSSESSSTNTGVGSVASSGGHKNNNRRRVRAQNKLPDESDSILRLLLANTSSLATLCLSRGDIYRAQQVIQIFQLSNSTLANETKFSEVYEGLASDISHVNIFAVEKAQTNEQKVPSSLEAVKKAALAGINAAGITSQIEKILINAPKIHGFERITSDHRPAAHFLFGLNSKSIAASDAALTLGSTRDASLCMLDVVSQHWSRSWSPEMKSANDKSKTFYTFMTNIMELFHNLEMTTVLENKISLPNFLKAWELPLSNSLLQNYFDVWRRLQEALKEFSEGSETSNLKNQIHALRKIIKVCGERSSYFESRGIVSSEIEQVSYLQNLFWYLQTFSSLVTKCSHQSEEHWSPFSILFEGWCDLLGRLVFDLDAPLGHVERVTSRLQLDLLKAVVSSCCPNTKLSISDTPLIVNFLLPIEMKWTKIILNAAPAQQASDDDDSIVHLASSLLAELIEELKSSFPSPILTAEDFTPASQNSKILNILSNTSHLNNMDLTVLKHDLEIVSFLCNIANLLFLHSLIVLGPDCGLASSHWSEKRSAFGCVGYNLGQMGFVSLGRIFKQLFEEEIEQILTTKNFTESYWDISDKRCLFVMTHGTINSPVIQVLDSDTADHQLNEAVANYLNRNVRVEGTLSDSCYALVIPRLVLRYLGLSSPSSVEHAEEAKDEPVTPQLTLFPHVTHLARDCAGNLPSLLAFLHNFARGHLKLQLAEWADAWNCSTEDSTDLIITLEEPSLKFGIVLPSSMELLSTESMQSSLVGSEDLHVDIGWEMRNLSPSVRRYLEHQSWLVALLAARLRQEPEDFQQTLQTSCLDRYLIQHMPALAPLNSGNVTLTALQPWAVQTRQLWSVLDRLLAEQQELKCIKLILSLPESHVANDIKIQTFKDILLFYMASQPPAQGIDAPWRLAFSLGSAELRAKCVLGAIKFWPGTESIDTLKAMLGETTLLPSTRTQLENTLHKVTIYQQVHQVLCYYQINKPTVLGGWFEVCNLSETTPGQVLQSLIEAKQYRLCLPWAELHGIPHRAQHLVNASFLSLLLELETADFSAAEKLLTSVPIPQAISICRRLLGSLTSLASLRYVVSFALERCQEWLRENPGVWSRLQLWSVGLSVIFLLPPEEQAKNQILASQPHLLIEQLLMNTRLAILSSALNILRAANLSALPAESLAQPAVIDSMLRQYATKALDFQVSRRIILPEVPAPMGIDDLLQSLSTGSTGSGPTAFLMPMCAPTKEQWVPNDEVTECMCCSSVAFSMFNRRHHCRRCGRVVCDTCSHHRTKVEGYGDLLVRTCDDCSQQMRQVSQEGSRSHLQASEPSSNSSQRTTEWRLLGEEPHDGTVREEFAFEHAPSVALCLSILTLHSDHTAAQPRFLLEAADGMLQLLIPSTPGYINPELDYSLVIRMARSLVVAAKVRYAKAALNSGVAHCDRLLGQVDLLALLVRSGCAALLPVEPLPLGGHALRHLRDRLVAAELWPLALEVSTKAGLERGGVWAAWGKACLRSGRWVEAQEHLAHCLQSPLSAQDPSPAPLLTEIINILEESSYTPDPAVMKQAKHIQAPALAVLHTLSSLTAISQGKFPTTPPKNTKPLFYSESQYYLRAYGSPSATLVFFISHSDLTSALQFIIERNIEPEIFAEALYKPCLRQGLIGQLHQEMKIIDPTLEIWKSTILQVGRLLERQGLLHSLYELQLYANDLVRAAMTCIRFYHAGARCYSDLAPEHLQRARKHLEEEIDAASQWTADSRDRDSESPSSSRTEDVSLPEAKLPLRLPARQLDHHINTIGRQLEVTKFLQQCESDGRSVVGVAAELKAKAEPDTPTANFIPTLFGSSTERAHLSALVILCGKNVEEGFGITFRIIQDFHLRASRAYGIAAHWLASKNEIAHIEKLIDCIRNSGSADSAVCSDELLLQCVHQVTNESGGVKQTDNLLKLIIDPAIKIQAHLATGQLKSAYLLAVKLGSTKHVQAVLTESDRLNQPNMRRICTQWLRQQKNKVS